ncbi:3-phenylpropionate/cinnamic acid dioxygenase ferredoxin subunit [Candidatus Entotheonellaceae bacterium PAL068K]
MSAIPTQTIRLASIEEVPESEGREFRVGKRFVALFRFENQFYAMEDRCPHAGAPLNNGPVQDGTVMCLWHGWCFNLHDGACVNLPRGIDVPTYPVSVRGHDVYVTLPADETEPS